MKHAAVASLDPEGPAARSIADLWWLMLGLGTAVFAVVVVLLVLGLFRRRAEPAGELAGSVPPEAPTSARFDRWLMGGGVIMPVVVLSLVLGASVWALRDVSSKAPRGAMVVEVVGHQWWWEVRYPEHGVVTANEVHIPVGRAVAFEFTSADVIHSFWVAQLGGKLDARRTASTRSCWRPMSPASTGASAPSSAAWSTPRWRSSWWRTRPTSSTRGSKRGRRHAPGPATRPRGGAKRSWAPSARCATP